MRDGDDGSTSSQREYYRWECPFCGDFGLEIPHDGSGKERVKVALRSHVLASDGAEHGPRFEVPDGFDPETLVEHILKVREKDGTSGGR